MVYVLLMGFSVCMVVGLITVLQQLINEDPMTCPLDFDLPRDLDHIGRVEIEPVHDLGRVAIEKSK